MHKTDATWHEAALRIGAQLTEAEKTIERLEGERDEAQRKRSDMGLELGKEQTLRAIAEAERDEARKARDELGARASTLEDAAFHFQSCPTCAQDGEESCTEGRKFAAFLRGESDWEDK